MIVTSEEELKNQSGRNVTFGVPILFNTTAAEIFHKFNIPIYQTPKKSIARDVIFSPPTFLIRQTGHDNLTNGGFFSVTAIRRFVALDTSLLHTAGTAFQRIVWKSIAAVPYGETIAYRDLASNAGRPASIRAAGAATGRNPLSIFIPCHRIVGADGTLTGYAGGLDRKRALLSLERGERVAQSARRAA